MPYLPVLLAVVIAAGTSTGVWWPDAVGPAAGCGGLAVAVVWAAAARRRPVALVLAAAVAGVGLSAARGGMAVAAAARPSVVRVLDAAGVLADDAPGPRVPVQVTGRLTADAAVDGPVTLLRMAVSEVAVGPCACPTAADGPLLLAVNGGVAAARAGEWRAGRTVRVTATLRRPATARNLGAPDPVMDLVRRRLALTGSVKSALLVEAVAEGSWAEEGAARLRARARRAIASAAAPDLQAAAVGTAVLVGDRAGLDSDLTARLQRAGTVHVIAISGGNIAVLSALAFWVCWRVAGGGPWALGLTAAVLVGYAFVVGGSGGASVLRATGMAVVGLLARSLDQRGAAVNVLAATGAALVVADPLLVLDTAFWLTVLATAGLLVGLGDDEPARPRWRRLGRALFETSCWAEIALLPVVASAFGQVTVAGVVLSAVAIPGMAVAQVAALAAVVADAVLPPVAPLAGVGLRVGAWLVVESSRVVDLAPVLTWRIPAPAPGVVAAYYAALVAWLWARVPGRGPWAARLRPWALGAVSAAAAWIAVAPPTLVPRSSATLEMVALDVGQGDAILLRFPNGRAMLVDAGGRPAGSRFDVGARVVGPALRAHGVRRLDYLVVTHADADHIGGATAIVEEFGPAEVWTGVPVAGDAAAAALRGAATAAGASWRVVQRGDRLAIGAVTVDVAHPPPPDWERQRIRNDDSVVLAVTFGGVRLVLTGDIGAQVEPEIAAVLTEAAIDDTPAVTVLKVAHHGSAGSTTVPFLEAVRPVVALISAGRDDPFGHPAPAAMGRLAAAHVDVWRTDRDGAVRVVTDGRRLQVAAISGRTRQWPAALPPARDPRRP
ncbi:MAG: DNA internalization-related competence protein ComEC/Rec2 [Vicinamibacterales bacterium]